MPYTVCSGCGNTIDDEEALLCHFCGASLNRVSGGAFGAMRSAGLRWVWVSAAVLLAVMTAIFLFR